MKRGIKALAVLVALVVISAGPQVFAFCDSSKETPAIFQCADRGYFAAPPAGAGAVTAVFWGIGFGNNTISNGLDNRGFGVSGKSAGLLFVSPPAGFGRSGKELHLIPRSRAAPGSGRTDEHLHGS